MNGLTQISTANLILAAIPVIVVIALQFAWKLEGKTAIYAASRMLGQLMIVGYFLAYLFQSETPGPVLLVITVMSFLSSWIALRTIAPQRRQLYIKALFAIAAGGGSTLFLITGGVLALKPWFLPRFFIPLAGMIFSNSMNAVSLAAERFASEVREGHENEKARGKAFQAAMIPITNSLFAVGLVSVPGMMTGQILSGVEPTIAARYQIMVMCMIYGSAGLSSAIFLQAINRQANIFINERDPLSPGQRQK